jgi:hypothetical protein
MTVSLFRYINNTLELNFDISRREQKSTMVLPPSGSSSSSWRTPSAENQAKYNLVPLPESFQPTKEEEDLLAAYETMRAYEKEASRIKEQAAKAKLAAADAKHRQLQSMEAINEEKAAPVRKNKASKKKRVYKERPDQHGSESDGHEEESDEDVDAQEIEESPQSLHERREAKLLQMREKLEEAKQTKEADATAAEEALRAQLLAEEGVDMGPSLKRKRQEPPTEKSSLIASLTRQQTPPHDFSQKLGLKSWAGTLVGFVHAFTHYY